jgi:hypothetical protein
MVIHLLFKDPELAAQYAMYVCDMLDSDFWNNRVPALVRSLNTLIGPAVEQDDQHLADSLAEFEQAQEIILEYLDGRKQFLALEFGCADYSTMSE